MKNAKNQGIIITQTPLRISLFGGGSDLPEHFNVSGGSVLGMAINKYVYVTINSLERLQDKKIKLSYSKLEIVDSPLELNHQIVKNILIDTPFFNNDSFIDIHSYSDLPSSSGLGSSSSFTVGMLNALYYLNGVFKTPKFIAKNAITIERVKMKEKGGWQDQIFASYGGFNKISFFNNSFNVEPIAIPLEKKIYLKKSFFLIFTNLTRSSSEIQNSIKISKSIDKKQCLKMLHSFVEE